MKAPSLLIVLLIVPLALAVAACGSSDKSSKGPSQKAAAKMRAAKPEALTSAKSVKPANPGAGQAVPLSAANAQKPAAKKQIESLGVRTHAARLGAGPEPSEADYDKFIAGILPVINGFWERETQKVNGAAAYEPPGQLISYNLSASPGCQGDRSSDMSHNAYYCNSLDAPSKCTTVSKNGIYCSKGDVIAWDKEGLLLPYFRQIGSLAPALVLAHEWGHLAQFRIFPQYKYATTIRNELQADCYAGAWALDQKRQGRTNIGELNEAVALFFDIGGPDQAWLDESSHGNKFQRNRAFIQGFEEDVRGCVGQAFDKRLEGMGIGKEKRS